MQTERPYVLTIAGFDPSSGAGLTADIKTFEQLKVYGLAVCTGLTLQTEDEFKSVTWRKTEDVKEEIELLLNKYPVKALKFGIVPSFDFLKELVKTIKSINPEIKIVVDPVWKSSTGFTLNNSGVNLDKEFLKDVTLITPNVPEFDFMRQEKDQDQFLNALIQHSNILLKGGHSAKNIGTDTLYEKEKSTEYFSSQKNIYPKHGSGCVLSAAITAYLAQGKNLKEACSLAKNYIEDFLKSNNSLLGFHAT